MRNFSPLEKTNVIRFIMEWMIDDFAMSDILSQTMVKWSVDEFQANKLLQEATLEWAKNERENNEQKRLRKIESLKKLKRSMKEVYKGTPAGLSAILNIEKELFKLESLGNQNNTKPDSSGQENKLSANQELFCHEYLKDSNGTQAYLRAGFKAKNDAVASVLACRLLRNVRILRRIEEIRVEMIRNAELTSDMVIQELRDLSDWNIQDFLNPDGTTRNLTELPLKKTKAVSGIKTTVRTFPDGSKQVMTELKFVDRRAVQVDLGRHTGAFTDKVDVTTKGKPLNGKRKFKTTLRLT